MLDEPVPRRLERLPWQTLHHVWAPKLGRTIVLSSTGQLRLWAMLEAHPGVTRYCERPSSHNDEEPSPMADFWAQRDSQLVWLAVEEEPRVVDVEAPSPGQAARVQIVTAGELDRHRVWISNWLSMLPYLSAAGWLDLESVSEPVVGFFRQEASFEEAEQHFSQLDPVLVRTAVIAGLHRGVLVSSELLVRTWDRRTRVARRSRRASHAPQ